MNYCSECGSPVKKCRTGIDDQLRFQCTACGVIHYKNPKIMVSCYATWGDKILWIRRNTEPFKGLWAAPSGFLEEGEDPMTAAARELHEETGAIVDTTKMQLHMVGTLMHMNQVYIVYRAPLLKKEFHCTEEACEVALLAEADFPVDEFAYPEVVDNVRRIYRDLQRGEFEVYMGTLEEGENVVRAVDKHH